MTKKTFTYLQQTKASDWYNINADLKSLMHKWQDSNKDFEITIGPRTNPRGEKALRAYWMLIGVVQKWMQDQGNIFTKEELSDYFKVQSGHKRRVNNVQLCDIEVVGSDNEQFYSYIPRSIANNSGCTFEDMKVLIDYILRFGEGNNIAGCMIEPYEWREFKTYYGVK